MESREHCAVDVLAFFAIASPFLVAPFLSMEWSAGRWQVAWGLGGAETDPCSQLLSVSSLPKDSDVSPSALSSRLLMNGIDVCKGASPSPDCWLVGLAELHAAGLCISSKDCSWTLTGGVPDTLDRYNFCFALTSSPAAQLTRRSSRWSGREVSEAKLPAPPEPSSVYEHSDAESPSASPVSLPVALPFISCVGIAQPDEPKFLT